MDTGSMWRCQLHPIIVYKTGFWVCAVLVLSAIMCPFINSLIECNFIVMVAIIIGMFMAILFILNYTVMLSVIR